jgi:hypothetical protein
VVRVCVLRSRARDLSDRRQVHDDPKRLKKALKRKETKKKKSTKEWCVRDRRSWAPFDTHVLTGTSASRAWPRQRQRAKPNAIRTFALVLVRALVLACARARALTVTAQSRKWLARSVAWAPNRNHRHRRAVVEAVAAIVVRAVRCT